MRAILFIEITNYQIFFKRCEIMDKQKFALKGITIWGHRKLHEKGKEYEEGIIHRIANSNWSKTS